MPATKGRTLSLVQPPRGRQKVLTAREKAQLQETILADATLDCVDFARADLRDSRFERVCFRGSAFCAANLVRAWFVGCDLTGADFTGARLGNNSFFGSSLAGATGMTQRQKEYVISRGGSFRRDRLKAGAGARLGNLAKGTRR
ncbi:MAG TPA: pentapeptide repeat-containing protein [Polyangia bacterium]|jgi:uncharacterized protein YjbI with pentapeptide repeats|nr:pentapeptide repeat-containing protein [Polyangia bacterium]